MIAKVAKTAMIAKKEENCKSFNDCKNARNEKILINAKNAHKTKIAEIS